MCLPGPGDDPNGFTFGLISAIIIGSCVTVTVCLIVCRILVKYKHALDERRLQRPDGVTTLILAFTNPDLLKFMPWTVKAFEDVSEIAEYPNTDVMRVTLVRLMEDIPEFGLQLAFVAVSGADVFTILNLSLTVIMLTYLIVGKVLAMILFGGSGTDQHKQPETELMARDHVQLSEWLQAGAEVVDLKVDQGQRQA